MNILNVDVGSLRAEAMSLICELSHCTIPLQKQTCRRTTGDAEGTQKNSDVLTFDDNFCIWIRTFSFKKLATFSISWHNKITFPGSEFAPITKIVHLIPNFNQWTSRIFLMDWGALIFHCFDGCHFIAKKLFLQLLLFWYRQLMVAEMEMYVKHIYSIIV